MTTDHTDTGHDDADAKDHQIRVLAEAIVEAATAAGIVDGTQPMDGPMVLLIAQDVTETIRSLRQKVAAGLALADESFRMPTTGADQWFVDADDLRTALTEVQAGAGTSGTVCRYPCGCGAEGEDHCSCSHPASTDTEVKASEPVSIYDEVRAENERAHALHGSKSMNSRPPDSETRLRILVEEVGEVAKEFNDADLEDRVVDIAALRIELIQVSAMAAAWADACKPPDVGAGRCGACRDLGGEHTERPGCRFNLSDLAAP